MGKIAGISGPDFIQTRQLRIARLAKEDPTRVLTSLAHFVDIHWLYEAWTRIRKSGAVGVDGETTDDFKANLDERLMKLLENFKSGKYRAPPVRGVDIPKGNGKTRPIGIPTTEDKVLQMAVKMLLEPIYEQDFQDCSYGCRPGRSQHQALQDMWKHLMDTNGGWILEVDIKGFFENINHKTMREILNLRVKDGIVRRSIDKWLRAGICKGGLTWSPETGTPQGGVISPLLANIYLHEVVDKWIQEVTNSRATRMFRFVDDIIIVCTYSEDARRLQRALAERLAEHHLGINPEKTRLVNFIPPTPKRKGSKKVYEECKGFGFLGFQLHWGISRNGNKVVRRKTHKSRLSKKIKEIGEWCKKNRHKPTKWQHDQLGLKLKGHYNYYGVTGNFRMLQKYFSCTKRLWYKWLCRRSQRKNLTWKMFWAKLDVNPLPGPRIVHSTYRNSANLQI